MAREIFISYSRENLDKVKAVKKKIEQVTGAECWMDLNAIESGSAQFTQAIVDGINMCTVFLFMLSKESQQSKFSLRELTFAMKRAESDKEKHVVIVNIDDCHMTDEFEFMYGLTDMIAWNDQSQRDKLLKDLKVWIGEGKGVPSFAVGVNRNKCVWQNNTKKISKYVGWLLGAVTIGIFLFYCFKHRWLIPDVSQAETEELVLYEVKDSISGLYGYMDETGKLAIPYKWKRACCFSDGLGAVEDSTGKWGFVDAAGQLVIPCQWMNYSYFSEGMAAVEVSDNNTGFIDKTGEMVVPCKWFIAFGFSDGLARVVGIGADDGTYYINKTGEIVIASQWYDESDFFEGLAHVTNQKYRHGFIDKTGEIVIPCQWNYAYDFSEGLAPVQDDDESWGFINKKGQVVIPCQWKWCHSFSDGLALVQGGNGLFGFIDKEGHLIINCRLGYARSFCEGMAQVKDDNGKWGYIDKAGKLIIPYDWKYTGDFNGAFAPVQDFNNRLWWIDKTGKVVGER